MRWADTTCTSCGISNSSRASAAACITGQSESEPMTTPTRGVSDDCVTRNSLAVGSTVPDHIGCIDGSSQGGIKVSVGGEYIDVANLTSGTDRFAVSMDFGVRVFSHRRRKRAVEIMVFGTQIVLHDRVGCDRVGGS